MISALSVSADSYTVKKNETLSGISQRLLGSVKYMSEIIALNNIKDPDKIFEGQVLIMPGSAPAVSESSQQISLEPAPLFVSSATDYTVKSGDCLSKIAYRFYNSSQPKYVQMIIDANNLKDIVIYPEMKLVIPNIKTTQVKKEPVVSTNFPDRLNRLIITLKNKLELIRSRRKQHAQLMDILNEQANLSSGTFSTFN